MNEKFREQNIIYWTVFFSLLFIGFVTVLLLDIFLFSYRKYSLTFGWLLAIPFTSLSMFVVQLIPNLLVKYSTRRKDEFKEKGKVGLTIFFTFVYVVRYFIYIIPLLIAIIVDVYISKTAPEIFNIFSVIASILCMPISGLVSNLFWLEKNVTKKLKDEKRRDYEPTGDRLSPN